MKIAPSDQKHPSLQSRIASFYFFSFFAVFLVSAPALYFYWMSVFNSEMNGHLVQRAQLIGHVWLEESHKGPSGLQERMDKDIAAGGMSVAIYDSRGRLSYRHDTPAALPSMSESFMANTMKNGFAIVAGRAKGRYRTVAVPIRHRGGLEGFVVAEFSMKVANHLERTFMSLVPVIAAALFVVAFLLSKALGAGMLRSIGTVTDATYGISAEHFDERIDTAKLDVEFLPLAENFNRMCDRLRESFANLRSFTSDASHQLRTPLAIIKNNLEVTLRLERAPDEYIEAISGSLEEIDRLSRIVNGLLVLTRSGAGEKAFKMAPLDFTSLVREVVDFIAPLAEAKHISLASSFDGGGSFRGDEEWLRQLVFNLLDNAIKYCRPSDSITVRVARENGNLLLRVSDTGPGIPREHLPRVLERFYRAPDSNANQSAGIGLALCQLVVRGHRGAINVNSDFGKGTSVLVTLPIDGLS